MLPSSFPGVGITCFCFCLFLFHFRAITIKHINAKINVPKTERTIAAELGDDVDDVDDGGGSKIFVHLYSLLLLMSSNKISLSVDWS